jgi:hypothetical protein
MNRTRPPNKEIDTLRELAAWYREWAEVTDSPPEKAKRLGLADYLEREARKREKALSPAAAPEAGQIFDKLGPCRQTFGPRGCLGPLG